MAHIDTKFCIFDVDGTLIRDNIGITFVRYLNSHRAIKPTAKILVALGYSLYKLRLAGFKTAIRLGYIALSGLSKRQVSELAKKCFDEQIRPNLYRDGIREIDTRKKEGYVIILATGAHESIANILAEFLAVDELVCTKSETIDDSYSWRASGNIPYREGKREMVAAMIEKRTANRDVDIEVIVYSDDEKDLPLFDLADTCVGINADDKVTERVKKRGGVLKTFQ